MKQHRLSIFVPLFIILTVLFCVKPCNAGKPNVVLMIADDMGWADTGYIGSAKAKTPVLNEMSQKGIFFDHFYCAGAICCAGRYAILTGRAPLRGGISGNDKIRPEEMVIAQPMRLAGYQTAYFGKWHIGKAQTSPLGMGYDHAAWLVKGYERDPRFQINDGKGELALKGDGSVAAIEAALMFIREQVKNQKPFFATVGFSSPHSPYDAAPEFKEIYKDLPEEEANYYGEISGIDAAIGKLRQELRSLGIAENTLIWFMGDNGGQRNGTADPAKLGKHDGGARTVSVLEWPGQIAKPGRSSIVSSQVDVYPTLVEMAGVSAPNQPVLDGISLVPVFKGTMTSRTKPLPIIMFRGRSRSVPNIDFVKDTQGIWIDGKYQLVVEGTGYKEAGFKDNAVRLFDIYEDLALKKDLSGNHPDLVQKMRTELEKWKQSVWDSYKGKDFPAQKRNPEGSRQSGQDDSED